MLARNSSKSRNISRATILASLTLATTALTPPGQASEFPAVIPLSTLDGSIGFRLDGVTADDLSGRSVAGAGDVNGDGFADLIVGAYGADPHGSYSGSIYVVFGKASGFAASINLSTLNGSNGFRLDGVAAGDRSGFSVAGAGDVNGDGFTDLIAGASRADPHGVDSGSSYVMFGKATGFAATINLSTLNGTNGFRLDGVAAYDFSGSSVSSAGDVNGDGFADLIVGAQGADPHGILSGSSYVVFGKASGFAASINLSTLNGSNGFRLDGVAAYDISGSSIASAGDVNGDGFTDLIVGAYGADPHGSESGSSYVVFGKASGFAASVDLSSLNGTNGFRLDGENVRDRAGRSVASAGDVNGDGFADLIIGARGFDHGAFNQGAAYVVFGKGPASGGFAATINLSTFNGTNGFRLTDWGPLEYGGTSVASAGDVNGDGFADVLVGACHGQAHDGGLVGWSRLFFGKASGFAASIDSTYLYLAGTYGHGCSVAGAGDVNGDGFADLIVGAFHARQHGEQSGSSYVVFGRAPDSARTRVGAAANQYISGGPFNDALFGHDGDDRLEGRGGADRMDGGFGSDTASYAHAGAGVTVYLAAPRSNNGDAAGDSYNSLENLTGSQLADTLTGNGLANRLDGLDGADWLRGGGGSDRLNGGKGLDVLIGGDGADIFAFMTASESPAGSTRDRIVDFNAGDAGTSVDRIDLRAIDAKTGPGNQAFTFIGTNAFSGISGQLRVQQVGATAVVSGDVNGDRAADLQIALLNFTALANLTSIDFLR